MNTVIKSCRNLLLLLCFANCNNNGEPAALSFFYDSTSLRPVIVLKLEPQQYEAHKTNLHDLLFLRVIENNQPSSEKVITDFIYRNDSLLMTPHFLPNAGIELEAIAVINRDTMREKIIMPDFEKEYPLSEVAHIYPSDNQIPQNILMFHIVFNHPMNEDPGAFNKIKLIDENGEEKQMVWRERSNWTSDGKHLVMMIHPGWVKRDIHYLDKYGPDFKPGKKYTLIVCSDLKDKYNRNIGREYKKEFVIAEPDRAIPVVTKSLPIKVKAGTKDSVFISFSEAIDYGSALIGIYLRDAAGNIVEGDKVPRSDNNWIFIPKNNWKKKQYTLELTQELSDVACNNLFRRFEEPDIEKMKPASPVKLTFTPD